MIYVGIDIANESNVCSTINEKGVLLKKFIFTNNVIGFNKLNLILNKYRSKKSIRIGFESTSGIAEGLKQYLEKHQYIYMEVEPEKISAYRISCPGHINKTDDIDARLIAEWLRIHSNAFHKKVSKNDISHLVREYHRLSKEHERIMRGVNDLLKRTISGISTIFSNSFAATQCGMYLIKNYVLTNSLNSICDHTYIRLNAISRNRLPREKFAKLLYLIKNNPITVTENLLIRFRSLIDSLENNEKNKVQIESSINDWVKTRNEKMMGIPGVGPILYDTLLATTGDIKEFSTFNKFYTYTGLYPKRYQTGENTQIDKVAKEGSKLLKKLYINVWKP